MKRCINCNIDKEYSHFIKRKKCIDGYGNQCTSCLNNLAKIRNNNLSNEEKERRRKIKKELGKKYHQNNVDNPEFVEKLKKQRKERHVKRLSTDPLYKIKIAYARRLNKYLRRGKCDKSKNAPYFLDRLGCTFEEFKIYLESKFEDWMSWENYGKYNGEVRYGWDIDHIIPLSTALSEDDIYSLSHYSNLQPLCSKTNRDIKKNK